jgi:hypothetical protein
MLDFEPIVYNLVARIQKTPLHLFIEAVFSYLKRGEQNFKILQTLRQNP